MKHNRGIHNQRSERSRRARVRNGGIVWSRRQAKSILLQAYLECLNTVCHYKQRDFVGDNSDVRTTLVKMITSKTKLCNLSRAHELCLCLWNQLSSALVADRQYSLPGRRELQLLQGYQVILRLALLADFYRYQSEVLIFNKEESETRLDVIRSEGLKFFAARGVTLKDKVCVAVSRKSSDRPQSPVTDVSQGHKGSPVSKGRKAVGCTTSIHRPSDLAYSYLTNAKLDCASDTQSLCRSTHRKLASEGVYGDTLRDSDEVKWSRFSFSSKRHSYYAKLIKVFQLVKATGHPMLTINSEWGLSCYYKLSTAYTTDCPLELAAGCLPQLRESMSIIQNAKYHQLSHLQPDLQMLLYAVLNSYINWVDHNHKQITLVPGHPVEGVIPKEGDLRCSRCLKNQTFHSSEVKGNPRNIDVEFDFESMKFGSSCCAAPMINVPLSTKDVNTCTFTEMKQMYTACDRCKQVIFSEVLVDVDTLQSRCANCASKDAAGAV